MRRIGMNRRDFLLGATALGTYDAYVNGRRVGADVLKPGDRPRRVGRPLSRRKRGCLDNLVDTVIFC